MEKLNNNTLALQALLTKVNNLPEGGSSGGGGAGGGTCSVEIIAPGNVCVFGWGEARINVFGTVTDPFSMPSTEVNRHSLPFDATYIFDNIPVGSTFTFYSANGIKGASVTGGVEFGLANHTTKQTSTYLFGVCRCNGDGTITIQV
jgi:hypothetical protein